MVAYRKLPSGKWQATVSLPQRLPSGEPRRVTKTHVLKGVVRDWGTKLEAEIAAGTWSDPRSGDLILSAWHAEWHAGRVAAGSTTRKDDSHWRVHVEPRWGGHPLNTITNRDLRLWIVEMHERQCRWCRACPQVTGQRVMSPHRGPDGTPCQGAANPPGLPGPTVRGAVTTLSSVLTAAVRAGLLPANPATGLKLPRVDAKPIFWWTRDEAAKLLAQLDGVGHAVMVDLDLHCGLRLGELLGLQRKYVEEVAESKLIIHVVGVQTRDGYREYPKSVMSRRDLPVPQHLTSPLLELMKDQQPGDFVFAAPGGTAWDDRNWSRRVFEPALVAAGIRRGTPHDMRHTAASWLVQKGVHLYVVQALLGHESFKTTQRYAHLAPDSFEKVILAWEDMD